MVDWGLAGRIGAFGFGLVFVVLFVLSLSVWLLGALLRRFTPVKPEAKQTKRG